MAEIELIIAIVSILFVVLVGLIDVTRDTPAFTQIPDNLEPIEYEGVDLDSKHGTKLISSIYQVGGAFPFLFLIMELVLAATIAFLLFNHPPSVSPVFFLITVVPILLWASLPIIVIEEYSELIQAGVKPHSFPLHAATVLAFVAIAFSLPSILLGGTGFVIWGVNIPGSVHIAALTVMFLEKTRRFFSMLRQEIKILNE